MDEKLNMIKHRYKAALFDLDGTLLDTLQDIAESMNKVLEKHGLPIHPVDRYRYFVGDGAKILVERVLPPDKASDKRYLERCLKDFLALYAQNWDSNAVLYPGISDMLETLDERGFALAVLSNKPHDFTRLCVKKFLNRWKFPAVFGERPGIKRKPSPQGALEIAKRLGVKPQDCIYLGDTSIDMKTALAAGMFPVGALWGFRDEEELRKAGAKLILASPRDLIRYLNQA